MNQPGELSEKNGLGFLAALQEPEPWGWWFKKRPDIYGFIDVE